MLYVAFGGGVNSAVLFGLLERGIVPDWVVFADTGGEKTETYIYCIRVAQWLHSRGLDIWHWVAKDSVYESLEDECLKKNMIPSLAYGYRSCSDKWKQEPQRKFLNHDPLAMDVWAKGEKITKVIGYSVEELGRAATDYDDKKYHYWYPMIEWRWNRNDCKEAIKRAGLEVPPKSSCFFCPAMKKHEIVKLDSDLYERAIKMEQNAHLTTIKGLGRHFSWKDMVGPETVEQVCMCFDGED